MSTKVLTICVRRVALPQTCAGAACPGMLATPARTGGAVSLVVVAEEVVAEGADVCPPRLKRWTAALSCVPRCENLQTTHDADLSRHGELAERRGRYPNTAVDQRANGHLGRTACSRSRVGDQNRQDTLGPEARAV